MKPPFSDASVSEVCIRVAYALIKLDYRKNPQRYDNPSDGVNKLSWELRWLGNQPLHLCFAALALFLNKKKGKLKDAIRIYIDRARYAEEMRRAGTPWKPLCAPPVSNTGGTPDELAVMEAVLNPFDKPKKARVRRARH